MTEIGGYFERDPGGGRSPLPAGILLNSGRNALRHIIRRLGIRRLYVPDYTCPVVGEAVSAEACDQVTYRVGPGLMPLEDMPHDAFVVYTNYFGCCGRNVEMLAARHPNLIVDCAQAYFAEPKGRASFSSPRKFFGVGDGGVAFGVGGGSYEMDDSTARQMHLLVRRERGAAAGYPLFRSAEESLDGAPIKEMSLKTKSALARVDLAAAAARRRMNFSFLHEQLSSQFPFSLAADDVPMVYPLLSDDRRLRERLIANGVFVAKYWVGATGCESLSERLVPLPVDQRYGIGDMRRIVQLIREVPDGC